MKAWAWILVVCTATPVIATIWGFFSEFGAEMYEHAKMRFMEERTGSDSALHPQEEDLP